ncbi:class I SAM-dependent methyltransferase [Budvicia aquatica]|uniref:Class I SAM-dependent methyltransferase n=1 Tax=Budvicia aquatica TaxID=82979 RepID=A0A2C6C709_9GAMM|nr:class I SAM-dependent methyltransferase [Budvicia aquatica]PHI32130.1 class I SAM-dependent methyltransferase [Budvicia aquatica]VFS53328.1 Malonyl-CoA O-methyltransferase BioC [Budvicia aquatica]
MTQNIYDDQTFFDGYAQLSRSVDGLNGAPEWPAIKKMLPDLKGLRVIDLGCGYGWFCRSAREQGAAEVMGLDLSQKMLNKAKSMTHDEAISYRLANLESLELAENSYDLAYSSLALHYIVNLPQLLKTIYNSLVSGGYLVFSAEHPIFTAPKHQGWIVDAQGQKSWPVNNYQAEGQRITHWLAEGVVKQHRMLGTYINLLIDQGFTISHLEEWGPTPQQIVDTPALDEEKERPMIFLLSARK